MNGPKIPFNLSGKLRSGALGKTLPSTRHKSNLHHRKRMRCAWLPPPSNRAHGLHPKFVPLHPIRIDTVVAIKNSLQISNFGTCQIPCSFRLVHKRLEIIELRHDPKFQPAVRSEATKFVLNKIRGNWLCRIWIKT